MAARHRRVATLLLMVLAASTLVTYTPAGPAAAADAIDDFDKVPIITEGLDTPTAFRFTPDGEIIIAEKGGALRLFHDGELHETPMVTVPTANSDERGLLGLELDPDYATNGYIYVAYTHADNRNRLSRLTVVGDTISLASEVVLLRSEQSANVFHHGGEVRFGADGKLYWGLGMNLYNPNSQNLGTIEGKLLRINRDGTIPADNPFVGVPGAEPSIWAYGLRNAFRFDMLPASAGANAGKPLVGDVGGSTWEEIDLVDRGADYGWPDAEGDCIATCDSVDPVFAYEHTDPPSSAGSITAVEVYDGASFPSEYQGAVFYADYTLGFIRYLKMDGEYGSVLSDDLFDSDAGTPVQLTTGPDGDLYQLDIYPGALYRITPSGGNRAPVAQAAGTPTNGLAPLGVAFSSAGSTDPDGTPLTYAWDFGDGATSALANPSHTYAAGSYVARLTVSDGSKTSSATVPIASGNRAPTGTITAPTNGLKYNAGDVITYGGTGTDPEDGALPPASFSWSVMFHHAEHIHPFLGPIDGAAGGSFTIPRNADNVATTWYEIQMTVTDAGGLEHTSSVDVRPNLVTLGFAAPAGLAYTVDGLQFTAPRTEQAVVGVERVISAASPQFAGGTQHLFAGWSDGGAQTHTIRTPAVATTYTASFNAVGDPPAPFVSTDIGARTQAGTSSYSGGTYTIAGGGNDVWDTTDELRFVHQPLNGDGEIVARVTGQGNTSPWAKSGVMVKETATPMAKWVALLVTPSNGMHLQTNFTGDTDGGPFTFPTWMKLKREGNVFTASRSADGVTWTTVGSSTLAMGAPVEIGLFVSSHNMAVLNTSTFDNVTVTATAGQLPAPWVNADVGAPATAGSSSYTGGTFSVTGAGNDIWGTVDQFQFAHQPLSGDGEIVARATGQGNTDPWAKSGVMVKESTTAGSKYVALAVTPGNGLHLQTNFTGDVGGGPFTFPNAWLKLKRQGNVFTASRSSDGVTWTVVGTSTLSMGASVRVGLFVTSHNGGVANTSTFDNVTVTAGASGQVPPPWSSADIGTRTQAGTSSFANGTYTVAGGGFDVWGTTDELRLVHQPLSGDGEIVARVTGQGNTDPWAKSGVMVKESTTSGSKYVALAVTPGNGLHLQTNFTGDVGGGPFTFPTWLKLKRQGNVFTASRSTDGVTWTTVGTTTLAMTASVKVGLFVSSHNGGVLNTTTFDNVTVTAGSAGQVPAPWVNADVGAPISPGSSSYTGGTFSVTGGGDDIWGAADQFQYVRRPLNGDGSIVARVTGLTAADPWSKAGVIIKQSTAAGSPYALLAVTPGNGTHFQHHFNGDQAGPVLTPPAAWLRLTRVGLTVTAATSPNGTTWTDVGSTTLALEGPITMGLFVTSHHGPTTATATFTNVATTSGTVAP